MSPNTVWLVLKTEEYTVKEAWSTFVLNGLQVINIQLLIQKVVLRYHSHASKLSLVCDFLRNQLYLLKLPCVTYNQARLPSRGCTTKNFQPFLFKWELYLSVQKAAWLRNLARIHCAIYKELSISSKEKVQKYVCKKGVRLLISPNHGSLCYGRCVTRIPFKIYFLCSLF